METKFSKGKWGVGIAFEAETENIKIKNSGKLLIVANDKGEAVSIVGRIEEEENQANAKLIASAPEMFELLNNLVYGGENIFDRANELLNKITE